MHYVLSMVHPPENGAAFGKATVFEPTPLKETAAFEAARLLGDIVELDLVPLAVFSHQLKVKNTGTDILHEESGVTFRIDPADTPPNRCPCCGRLVKPEDSAFAGEDDTLCDGCYPWHRTTPQCLPENSAHTEEPA
jgi:hypothetical protein